MFGWGPAKIYLAVGTWTCVKASMDSTAWSVASRARPEAVSYTLNQ